MTQITLHDAATVLLAAINRKEEEAIYVLEFLTSVAGYQMRSTEQSEQ
jgi:hypothetical protein